MGMDTTLQHCILELDSYGQGHETPTLHPRIMYIHIIDKYAYIISISIASNTITFLAMKANADTIFSHVQGSKRSPPSKIATLNHIVSGELS